MKKVLFVILVSLCLYLVACQGGRNSDKPESLGSIVEDIEGYALGTSYTIKYVVDTPVNYQAEISELMNDFENSMSPFRPQSVISRINKNDSTVFPDQYFTDCFNEAEIVSERTNGAFDITVAPLVNAWGFGFEKSGEVTDSVIAQIKQHVGYKKIHLVDGKLMKDDSLIMLDGSAIAKGQCVDVVCLFFENKGIENYMVEIGGEVRAKGMKPGQKNWIIGIDKPIDNSNVYDRELQEMIVLKNSAVATSGNYRQFYLKDGVKYSHTIDPVSGYPVSHNLLSVSVLTDNCMTADAYATAFMVLGYEKSLKIVEANPKLDAYFILAGNNENYIVR